MLPCCKMSKNFPSYFPYLACGMIKRISFLPPLQPFKTSFKRKMLQPADSDTPRSTSFISILGPFFFFLFHFYVFILNNLDRWAIFLWFTCKAPFHILLWYSTTTSLSYLPSYLKKNLVK